MVAFLISLFAFSTYATETAQDFTVTYRSGDSQATTVLTCVLTPKELKKIRKHGDITVTQTETIEFKGDGEAAVEEANAMKDKMISNSSYGYGYAVGDFDITAVSSKVPQKVLLKNLGNLTRSTKAYELVNTITALCR